jgi:hypothetical protein
LVVSKIARADQEVAPLSPHADEYRGARAEITAGAITLALAAVGALLSAVLFAGLQGCSPYDLCDSFHTLFGAWFGVNALIEGAVGFSLYFHGSARRAKARARFLPVAGPRTVGASFQLAF